MQNCTITNKPLMQMTIVEDFQHKRVIYINNEYHCQEIEDTNVVWEHVEDHNGSVLVTKLNLPFTVNEWPAALTELQEKIQS